MLHSTTASSRNCQQDVRGVGAERLADADLARPLGDRDEHDVHDADAGDDQRDDADDEGADLDAGGGLVEVADRAVVGEHVEVVLLARVDAARRRAAPRASPPSRSRAARAIRARTVMLTERSPAVVAGHAVGLLEHA